MRLEVEGQPPVAAVGEAELRVALSTLRSEGPASFACLTDEAGDYLQVASGGVTCMIERHEARGHRHFRAFQNGASGIFADGTQLVFGSGAIRMRSDEWFTIRDVEAVFVCFLRGEPLPRHVRWRDISGMLSRS
ncbi:hypothetical protein ACQVP2_23095 [Methylobacterium aquaticum]|uniref:hypothetical protein n=1 Tax=Methylobacterium aquaticum TaxID=270351 RepID=UPI003D1740B7